MRVVRKKRKRKTIDTKDRRQMFQAFTSPFPSVLKVFTRYQILSAQKRTQNATVVDVDDLNCMHWDQSRFAEQHEP